MGLGEQAGRQAGSEWDLGEQAVRHAIRVVGYALCTGKERY